MPTKETRYRVLTGPEGILPPAAALMGVLPPDLGMGLVEGEVLPEDKVIEVIAEKILTRRNPTLFPGPLLVWAWTPETQRKATAVLALAREIPGARIICMPDYRPIYPKIDPESVLSPCHPNLTILHNKIEVCMLIDAHCHFVNVTLKMIRAGTNCYTITLCANDVHEDSVAAMGPCTVKTINRLKEAIIRLRDSGKIVPWAYTTAGKEEIRRCSNKKMFVMSAGQDLIHKSADSKEEVIPPGFLHDLEPGLDENEE
ncbi:MAG: 2-oxoglutarate:ferredoxin oxidoreductase [Nitrospirae bacterium]|nr:2-oxoglutarate:ferredoxin oxidoreductase [Nitrospirota bacterium]MBI3593927.1 2-oxoglutarate:ferredoxin oxidoreductase [Nitrospirota bacterium]